MDGGLQAADQQKTLLYYQENADSFVQGTLSADMSDLRSRFLRLLPPGGRILDLGCGSGRDSRAFLDLGYAVDAADGSPEMCRLARELTGQPVRQMLFGELDAREEYDGIWACASILHLPRQQLPDVLGRIARALKPGGVLYTSFKHGGFEGIRGGRYFTDLTLEAFTDLLGAIPDLLITGSWITGDVRPGRENERWLNLLLKKVPARR